MHKELVLLLAVTSCVVAQLSGSYIEILKKLYAKTTTTEPMFTDLFPLSNEITTETQPFRKPIGANRFKGKLQMCTIEGESGVCVRNYLCKNGQVVKDGSGGIFDFRENKDLMPVTECPNPQTCCRVEPNRNKPTQSRCGMRNPAGVEVSVTATRITGNNNEAKFGEFPWLVALFNVSEYIGAGSLIHPSVVLTAAHIVHGLEPGTLRVRAGEWEMQTTAEPLPHQDRNVATIEFHEEFDYSNGHNDIAMLFLATPVTLAPHVGLACLPASEAEVPSGTGCYVMGWGKQSFKDKTFQNVLKRVKEPVIDRDTCEDMFRQTRLGYFYELHDSFMCAGGLKGASACTGDGGASLMCRLEFGDKRYVQSGILSLSVGCGQRHVPEAYVDVAKLRPWIDQRVKNRGYDTSVYDISKY